LDEYMLAQRAVADLKSAVLSYVRTHAPATNAEIGRALGIYFGHIGHEGHVSRSILHALAAEGLLVQDAKGGPWRTVELTQPSRDKK
jgi:hypothetical protein